MPVLEHETHPSTIHNDMRYTACQNKVRKGWYWKLVTFFDGTAPYQEWREIEDTSSTGCRYMDFETDAGCGQCKVQMDLGYINKMKELK